MDQDLNETFEEPLSPVLKSSTSRKFNRNRKKNQIKLLDRIETKSPNLNENLQNNDQLVNTHSLLDNSRIQSEVREKNPVGFQTASGKELSHNKSNTEVAKVLFGEILDSSLVTKRENKFNFLSKSSSSSLRTESQSMEGFAGFSEQEFISAQMKSKSMSQTVQALSLVESEIINIIIGKSSRNQNHPHYSTIKKNDNKVFKMPSSPLNSLKAKNVTDSRNKELSTNSKRSFIATEVDLPAKKIKLNEPKSEQSIKRLPEKSYKSLDDQMETIQGFSTASGNAIKVSTTSYSSINRIFKDIPDMDTFAKTQRLKNDNSMLMKCDNSIRENGNEAVISEEKSISTPRLNKSIKNSFKLNYESIISNVMCVKIDRAEELKRSDLNSSEEIISKSFNGVLKCEDSLDFKGNTEGFPTASGKPIEGSAVSLAKVKKLFKDEANIEIPKIKYQIQGFSSASGKSIRMPAASLSELNLMFKDLEDFNNEFIPDEQTGFKSSGNQTNTGTIQGFSTASGKSIPMPAASLSKVNEVFKDIQDLNNESFSKMENGLKTSENQTNIGTIQGFSTASGKSIPIPNVSLAKVNNLFKDIPELETEIPSKLVVVCKEEVDLGNVQGFSTASGRKVEIPPTNSSEVNQVFNDIPDLDIKKEDIPEDADNITPLRPIPKKKKLGSAFCRGGKISDATMKRVKCLFSDMNFDDLKSPGPMKIPDSPFNSPRISSTTPMSLNRGVSTPYLKNSTPLPMRQSKKSFNDILNELPPEYNCPFLIQKPRSGDLTSWAEELKEQKLMLEKKLAFVTEKYEAISAQMNANLQTGSLRSIEKKKVDRIMLKNVEKLNEKCGNLGSINNVILQINPQNAGLIHFNGNWTNVATFTTDDGCVLVPNQQNLIGVSEIGAAFSSLPHIRRNLIPDGWIKNHYKWIIWKLASYERFFPSALGGCFTVDNVIKQLQYRYDRELYKCERPVLRRIYEMDDVAQKRMVLCISNIFKNGDNIELELTDGWYSIRSTIDELLCSQVNKRKIRIGSKLMISGAELLNCEGCYPLEVEQAFKVRLKICYNSTRRAAWYSKLGYQRNPMPLLVKLSSVNPAGGIIGACKVYIMRAYPLIYMEKIGSTTVWRNKCAEIKQIQTLENKHFDEYYKNEQAIDDELKKRNVIPILQMTVIDFMDNKSKPFKCSVWNSTEFHEEHLKENQIVVFYNLAMRSNSELSCNMKTRFEVTKEDTSKYVKYKRKYIPNDNIPSMLDYNLSVFDTVGFIVEISVGKGNQHFWLTDVNKNLLLVEINEKPENCLLLNRVQENQYIAVCNLTFIQKNQEYSVAHANFHTILTNYPQYKFLRDELIKLESMDRTELNFLLQDCKAKIKNLNSKKTLNNSRGNGLLSPVNSTDIVMSMINIDEVVNNTR